MDSIISCKIAAALAGHRQFHFIIGVPPKHLFLLLYFFQTIGSFAAFKPLKAPTAIFAITASEQALRLPPGDVKATPSAWLVYLPTLNAPKAAHNFPPPAKHSKSF